MPHRKKSSIEYSKQKSLPAVVVCVVFTSLFIAGCTNGAKKNEAIVGQDTPLIQEEATVSKQEQVTVRGTRLSVGNAVECTKISGDDGKIYAVSYLEPAIAIGDRIEVTGYMANVTECVGKVIYVEKVMKLGN